jgi:peptidyl-prolyl cis-trans isomerase C
LPIVKLVLPGRLPSAPALAGAALLLIAALLPIVAPGSIGSGLAAAAAANSDPVVLRVDGAEVHRSEILALQKSADSEEAQDLPPEEFYQQIAERLIDVKLLAAAARTQKLDQDPDVIAEIANTSKQVLTEAYVNRLQDAAANDAAVKALYDKTVQDQPGVPQIHARHILVKTEEEAKAIIAELNQGTDFAKLADAKSIDKSAEGGDLGWFDKDVMVPEFSDAAFKLGKGDYSQIPVQTQFGYHVIKVEDKRLTPPPSFDEAKEKLAGELADEAVETKVQELRDHATIEQFDLDGSPLPADPGGPVLMPPGK